jgi:two-component system, OmpR family, alkaline phosphatase synthesis response regulator PhoP
MLNKRVLVVDDEADILNLLKYNLEKVGFLVETSGSGEEALKIARSSQPDLILLDLMLPGLDGLDICRLLKNDSRTEKIPIVMLTAKGEEGDIVAGLELGADDYITKPFSPRVLLARIKTVLRRGSTNDGEKSKTIDIENISIDTKRHLVKLDGANVDLTATEFDILLYLVQHPGWVFTRSQIIVGVKGSDYPVTDRSVDVQILNLRRKLGAVGDYIETVRGVGYRFREL